MASKGMQQLTIPVTPELKRRIRAAAAARKVPMGRLAASALERGLSAEETGQTVEKEPKGTVITEETLELCRQLREEFKEPFTVSSADLIEEGRMERMEEL
jgi:predicted transcriptional regulator